VEIIIKVKSCRVIYIISNALGAAYTGKGEDIPPSLLKVTMLIIL
jgi:hypothetical protein